MTCNGSALVPSAWPDLLSVRTLHPGDESAAEAFVRAHPAHGPGHSRRLAAIEAAFGHTDLSVIALLGERVVAYAPVIVLESRQLRVLHTRTVAGGSLVAAGPLVEASLGGRERSAVLAAVMQQVRRSAAQSRADWVRYVLPAMAGDQSSLTAERPFPFLALGATLRTIPGAVIVLSASETELLGGMSATTRNLLRRSEREGLTARPIASRAEWECFRGTAPAAFGHRRGADAGFDAVYDTLIAPGDAAAPLAHATVIERGGELLSCVVTCESNLSGYYLLAFNSESGLACNANRFALWQAMLGARGRGVRWFQMGSRDFSAGKSGSISDFKQQFGGSVMLSPVAEWCERPMRVAGVRLVSGVVAHARRRTLRPAPAER